jgi:uncharacterized protein YjdB
MTEGISKVSVYSSTSTTPLASLDVTTSKAVPVATSVRFVKDSITISANVVNFTDAVDELEVKDQYGVSFLGTGFWTSSAPAKVTVNSVTGLVTGVSAGEATIGYVTSNGLAATMKVIVMP